MKQVLENNIIEKIKAARNLMRSLDDTRDIEKIVRLNNIITKAESAYNEVKINLIKSDAALIIMKNIETDLDNFLREVKN